MLDRWTEVWSNVPVFAQESPDMSKGLWLARQQDLVASLPATEQQEETGDVLPSLQFVDAVLEEYVHLRENAPLRRAMAKAAGLARVEDATHFARCLKARWAETWDSIPI